MHNLRKDHSSKSILFSLLEYITQLDSVLSSLKKKKRGNINMHINISSFSFLLFVFVTIYNSYSPFALNFSKLGSSIPFFWQRSIILFLASGSIPKGSPDSEDRQ